MECNILYRDDENVIQSFDTETISKLVMQGDISASTIFKVGNKWKDRKLVKEAADFYAAKTGWTAKLDGAKICCNCNKKEG